MTTRVPILILSDAPSASSGLGRICRDLALRIATELPDLYEVATLGYGGNGDKSLPFFQYTIEGMKDWYIPTLKDVWENFAGTRRGILFTIWDASRLLWLARPDVKDWCPDPDMRKWLLKPPFIKVGYFPMDASGPNGLLSRMVAECLMGYDRIISYTDWSNKMVVDTLSPYDCQKRDVVSIPHGIDTAIFRPYRPERSIFRQELQFTGPTFDEFDKFVGIVATNQTRKDYGMAIAALAQVAKEVAIRIFIQVDILERHWSIPALLFDYGILHRCIINTAVVTDEVMARIYSTCDLTLGIGQEGFGFPLAESLACGTPVISGALGGQAEFMDESMLVKPEITRVEGPYDCVRAVYDPTAWSYWIKKALRVKKGGKSLLPQRFEWANLWKNEWEPYFRKLYQSLPIRAVETLVLPSMIPEMDIGKEGSDTSIIVFPEVPST